KGGVLLINSTECNPKTGTAYYELAYEKMVQAIVENDSYVPIQVKEDFVRVTEYLKRINNTNVNVFEFPKYHVVGGWSIPNKGGMFSGKNLTEIYKKDDNDWIWKRCKKYGYVSMFADGLCIKTGKQFNP